MAPMGFEPTTPGLKVQCSDQAELRSHYLHSLINKRKNMFKKSLKIQNLTKMTLTKKFEEIRLEESKARRKSKKRI